MSTAAERCVEKWHARDCGCDNDTCEAREAAWERVRLLDSTIGTALRKAGWE